MAKNVWIEFLAKYRKAHPGKSMKQAMKDGAKEYKAKKGGAKKKGKKKREHKGGTKARMRGWQKGLVVRRPSSWTRRKKFGKI